MALQVMKKITEEVEEPKGKFTLPSATVVGIRKKAAPKYPIVQKGKIKYQMVSGSGDTTELKKEAFEKLIGKKQ